MLPYWGSLCAPGSAELRLFALNICFSRRLCSSPRWARAVPLLARCIVGCPRLCLHFLYLGIFLTTNWSFTPCFLNFCTWGPRICSLAQTARVKVWNVECSKAVVFPCRCASWGGFCGDFADELRCGACKMRFYCSDICQREEWKYHKAECRRVRWWLRWLLAEWWKVMVLILLMNEGVALLQLAIFPSFMLMEVFLQLGLTYHLVRKIASCRRIVCRWIVASIQTRRAWHYTVLTRSFPSLPPCNGKAQKSRLRLVWGSCECP